MPDELLKCFLEQMIESIDGISEALRIILQYYHVTTAESEFKKHTPENYADIDFYIESGNEYTDNPPCINLEIDEDID